MTTPHPEERRQELLSPSILLIAIWEGGLPFLPPDLPGCGVRVSRSRIFSEGPEWEGRHLGDGRDDLPPRPGPLHGILGRPEEGGGVGSGPAAVAGWLAAWGLT